MSRPLKKRNVAFDPEVTLFIPSGVPRCGMDTVTFGVDEIEALRLTDMEGMYQGQAAEAMGISRQTLGNILSSARRKASEALTGGKAMRIQAGQPEAIQDGPVPIVDGCSRDSGNGCKQDSGSGCAEGSGGGCNKHSPDNPGSNSGSSCSHDGNNRCRNQAED